MTSVTRWKKWTKRVKDFNPFDPESRVYSHDLHNWNRYLGSVCIQSIATFFDLVDLTFFSDTQHRPQSMYLCIVKVIRPTIFSCYPRRRALIESLMSTHIFVVHALYKLDLHGRGRHSRQLDTLEWSFSKIGKFVLFQEHATMARFLVSWKKKSF